MKSEAKQLPGPACSNYLERRRNAVARGVANGPPVFAARARGATIEDLDGRSYVDFAGGIGTLNVGYGAPELLEAVTGQAEKFLHTCFNIVMYPQYIELAEKLIEIVPGDAPKKVMLQTTGAEAVENAIKIARAATNRRAIVAFENAFHGRTFMALSLTAKGPAYKSGLGPFAPEVYRAPFPRVAGLSGREQESAVEAAFAEFLRLVETEVSVQEVAAVIIEPVQGEGGFNIVPPAFFRRLREYCSDHGIVLIADEIQTGFCRTGKWFATEHFGASADLYTLAKSMGGGMPIAAVVGRADLMDAPVVGALGGTYGGNPVSCAAALAAIRLMQRDDLAARANHIGERVRSRFEQWAGRFDMVAGVRGLGAMVAMDIVRDKRAQAPAGELAAQIVEQAYRNGVIVLKAGFHGNVIRFLGPLSMSDAELERGLAALGEAIATVAAGRVPPKQRSAVA